MRFRMFGRSGLRVSEVCLGAMGFGGDWGWGANEDLSEKIIRYYADKGGNFIDTANAYQMGHSERIVGHAFKGDRDRWVVATKYSIITTPDDPNAGGNHRKNMMHAIRESLERLQTDYIDIYWLHVWDETTPVEEVVRAVDDLVRQGKIHYFGFSDTPAWVVSRANAIAEERGLTPVTGLQLTVLIGREEHRARVPADGERAGHGRHGLVAAGGRRARGTLQ